MKRIWSFIGVTVLLLTVALLALAQSVPGSYLDYSGLPDQLSGGSRMIPVETPKGTLNVWVKHIGNNLRVKVLILHGGPGMTHEYLEAVDSYFPGAGIDYYHYDQLGLHLSD